jgi:hypothetical protein
MCINNVQKRYDEEIGGHTITWLAYVTCAIAEEQSKSKSQGRICGTKDITRKRRHIEEIFASLGPHYIRRSYRMTEPSFWKLFKLLESWLPSPKKS